MRERDLQDYLFANPQVLFPGQEVEEKAREFPIDGKRIDLLFKVDGTRFIVELKAVPLQREHVGQVTEYYGRMRRIMKEQQLRMILVAPSIPDYRKVYLEELGIRCVEIDSVPETQTEFQRVQGKIITRRKAEEAEAKIIATLPQNAHLSFEEVAQPVSRLTLAFSHAILRDSLEAVGKRYQGYEIQPVKMARADSPDFICGRDPVDPAGSAPISAGGAWWAYRIGNAEEMPKNDVPNVSIVMMPWGLDLTINAEVNASQTVLMDRVRQSPAAFDELLSAHGNIWLQTWLKIEHRPQFFHWISRARMAPGQWRAVDLLNHFQESERTYKYERTTWLNWVEKNQPSLSENQSRFLRKRSKNINLAIRLVSPFHQEDPIWGLSYAEQVRRIEESICRLKPLIEFFVGNC